MRDRQINHFRPLTAAAALGVVLAMLINVNANANAAEHSQQSIRLDSLVYASDAVVEARVVAPAATHVYNGDVVRVTAVYKGRVSVADNIIVDGFIANYQKSRASLGNSVPLNPADPLILFLTDRCAMKFNL
ncbi:MAG TPA: hypothetical protein VFC78_07675 [Tepidisphaeraceae bacterium]|nr:hypothetical protein [Tepidisphaeraceae bacterium]